MVLSCNTRAQYHTGHWHWYSQLTLFRVQHSFVCIYVCILLCPIHILFYLTSFTLKLYSWVSSIFIFIAYFSYECTTSIYSFYCHCTLPPAGHACSRAPHPHWHLFILAIRVGKQWVSLWVSFAFPLLLGNQAAFHTCIGHLDFLICKWLKSFASFSIGSSAFLLITCRNCKKKYSGYKPCVSFICSRYFFPIWGLFLHSVHRSVYPALYQNHSRQMSLNNYWPRLCSLGIRRLKVRYSQISKDLENQLERLGLDPRSKGVPQHVREHKREIMNKHPRKITLGVESQHESTEPRKECGGYWSGWRLRSRGPGWRRWQWKEKGRDASKRHLEEKAEMMALCYESVEEGGRELETEKWCQAFQPGNWGMLLVWWKRLIK